MNNVLIEELINKVGVEVTLKGWVDNHRSSGGVIFLMLRDGSGVVQVVVNKDAVAPEGFEQANSLTLESSVKIVGNVKTEERAPGGVELSANTVEIVQKVTEEFPIGKKEHGIDFLLSKRHLWLRSPKQWAIQRIRFEVIVSIYEVLSSRGFIKIDAPILTPNACEGTTTLFPVEYVDGSTVYLSQSGQLYLEAAIASFGRVFDFGPTFRAEKSKTRRHLTEFWMMDAEMAFVEHTDNVQLQEELVVYLVKRVLQTRSVELTILERDVSVLQAVETPFVHMTYNEAVQKLQTMGSAIQFGSDLGNEDETLLTEHLERPLVIEKYPADIKAFYMKRDAENSSLALCNDLLAPEGYGEIIGGSQREDDYEILKTRITEEGLSLSDFEWYLDLRQFGSVPHSGFGLGLERLVSWICGLQHVREAIPFPRTITRVFP